MLNFLTDYWPILLVLGAALTMLLLILSSAGWLRVPRTFKRWLPALLALAVAIGYYRYTADHQQVQANLAQAVRVGALNADAAVIAQTANTAVPPFGLVAGKLAFAVALFLTGIAVVWFIMRFVVPVLSRWATGHYTGELSSEQAHYPDYKLAFLSLDPAGRLRVFNTVWLALLGYFALCVLAACLVS